MAAKGAQPQLPAWVWLFTGVVTGLFVAFLIYLANLQSPIPTEPPPRAAEKPAKTIDTRGVANRSTPESPRKFDFYTILPEAEALGAPDDDTPGSKPIGAAKEAAKPKDPVPGSTAAATQAGATPAAGGQRFFLQTGSFPRTAEADKLRAQLLLLGLPTSVQKVELEPGKVWHRVQAGPFPDKASLTAAQQKLASAHIQAIVVRPKTP
jgi:cell division protein FtsN